MACPAAPRFVHPGTFMSSEMTHSLADTVRRDPYRAKALEALVRATPLGSRPHALQTVHIDWGGSGCGHKECTEDGQTAVSAAILYWATRDRRYADLALEILRAWATTNREWSGKNALLEASWSVCAMARAAELLKHAPDATVAHAWAEAEPAFLGWLDRVIMPVLRSEEAWHWPPPANGGNWIASQICARMQLAILREDAAEWSWCAEHFPKYLRNALVCHKNPYEFAEMTRDLTHAQFNLGSAVQAYVMATHQGVNLCTGNQELLLHGACELLAEMLQKEVPPGFTPGDIHTPYGYWPEPIWHLAYACFDRGHQLPMPKTRALLDHMGPDRATFHWGPNALTHGI